MNPQPLFAIIPTLLDPGSGLRPASPLPGVVPGPMEKSLQISRSFILLI